MPQITTEIDLEDVRRRMKRMGLALIFWLIVFCIISLSWAFTVAEDFYGDTYFSFFIVVWFFCLLLHVGYLMDVEETEKVFIHRDKH